MDKKQRRRCGVNLFFSDNKQGEKSTCRRDLLERRSSQNNNDFRAMPW